MTRFLRMFAIALLALFIIVPAASAQRGGFRGGFGGGGFYGRGYYGGGWGGGWYGPGWGYGWYGPWGYPYGYGSGYYGGSAHPYGEVKIVDAGKDAMVYVDGGYAGKVGDLKKFRLSAGSHDIELRDPSGHTFRQEKIDVLPGKTLEFHGSTQGH